MTKPLAVHQDNLPGIADERPSLLTAVIRAASDPNVDVDKMERLMAMAERLEARNARTAYYAAMAEMKPDLPIINRRGRIEVREKVNGQRTGDVIQNTSYARWEDIDEALTPVLHNHGFALTFRPGVAQDGKITVTGILTHREGHTEEATITLPHDSTGSKNAVQAVGSSTSYGKRYAATMLLNIRTKGEDDDGATGGAEGTISQEQINNIRGLIERFKVNIESFCKVYGIEAIPDLPAAKYREAIERLNTKGVPK